MRLLPWLAAALLALLPALPEAAPPPGTASGPAASGPAPSAGAVLAVPSDQARALSRALIPRQTWDRLLDRSAEGLSQAVTRSLATKGARVPDGLQGNIRRELGHSMKYDSAIDTQAEAIQKRFTAEEMDGAVRFYGSPLGQKVLQRLPEAQGEVGDALQQQLAVVVPEILRKVAPDAVSPSGQLGGAGPGDGASSPETEGTGGAR